MSDHKYSYRDLERMRAAISLLLWPRGADRGPVFGPIPCDEQNRIVEDNLRTYMQNGTTADELDKAVKDSGLTVISEAR